jgi:O-succinylbenzoic acid--CoA ligase
VSGGSWIVPDKCWTADWAVNQAGVTHLSLVATQLRRMMQIPSEVFALRKSKAILLGGSAMSKSLIGEAYRQELPIITTYGSTETASQVTATSLGDALDKLWTSGKCLPDRELRISSTGEILVSGGIIGQVLSERESMLNWYHTGDFGYLDSDGYLTVLGRIDNRYISGGENIYPEEIERALLEHPDVELAVIVPKNDLDYGQVGMAYVQMRSGLDLSPDALKGFLKERMAGFKVPKEWRNWPQGLQTGFKISRKFFLELTEVC